MPKGSAALTKARREEIVQACARLYETRSFREITLKEIGAQTTFTRTSIYNYFHTKEEIFLALLQQEHEAWNQDLAALCQSNTTLTAEAFAGALATPLEKRTCMLKLMSMNLYDLETNSRLENLAAFKREYAATLAALQHCLEVFFPAMTGEDRQAFLYAFFPFLFGVYPYTTATEKQKPGHGPGPHPLPPLFHLLPLRIPGGQAAAALPRDPPDAGTLAGSLGCWEWVGAGHPKLWKGV